MPPITKTNEELLKEAIEETSKKVANEIYDKLNSVTPASGSKISQILKSAKGSSPHTDEEKKKEEKDNEREKILREKEEKLAKEEIEKILKEEREKIEKEKEEKIKTLLEEKDKLTKEEKEKLEEIKRKEREEFDKEKEKLQKDLEDSEVFCPSCVSHKDNHEHKHKLKKTEKGTLKCTGDNCSTEYALIPTDSTYKCTRCGIPHKKPAETDDTDKCPLCGNKEFLKHDWSRVLSASKPKKK